ncbi:MAG TPA: hypothetical protein VK327_15035 [Candidatus Paceibacterota bacterium]|nr:hypothetical protein [Candidatus Paceibacterota bacterium]
MKLLFTESPGEWRKTTLLGLIGPTVILSVLCYRGVVSRGLWAAALAVIALVALCACLRPRWFRGHYRFTTRLGFYTFQFLGKVVLIAVFFVIVTPFGLILRLAGKDFLQLKSPRNKQAFWHPARQDGSLDHMY